MIRKIIGLLLVIISIILISNNSKEKLYINESNIKLIDNYYNKKIDSYIGVLKIPKINLERGFFDIDNKYNDVKYNIELIESKNPNNIILAAHSGTGTNAYFKDLYKLEIDDYIYLDYKNISYTYQIIDIYLVDKKGYIDIVSDDYNKLTLITCDQKDKTKQIVIISKLI